MAESAVTIHYDEYRGEIRRGSLCLAFRSGWTLANGERFIFWFRGSNDMSNEEACGVSSAILNSEPTISGEALAKKIEALIIPAEVTAEQTATPGQVPECCSEVMVHRTDDQPDDASNQDELLEEIGDLKDANLLLRARLDDIHLLSLPDGIEEKFDQLVKQWRKDTRHESSVTTIATNDAFQKIIGMGKDALTYILRDLQATRDLIWLWALEAIADEGPNARDCFIHPIDAWLEWGQQQGHLPTGPIEHTAAKGA